MNLPLRWFALAVGLLMAACVGQTTEPSAPSDQVAPTAMPASGTPGLTPTLVPTPAATSQITREATPVVSWTADQAKNATDGNPQTTWNSTRPPPEWFGLLFPRAYIITRLELDVSQTPAGETVHEIWFGNGPDLVRYARLGPAVTSDGQTITVQLDSPRVASRVLIRTLAGPSHVAWRDVRVFGAPIDPTPAPIRINLQQFVRGNLEMPTGIISPKDGSGRLFILEQKGRIRVAMGNGELRGTPFMNLAGQVSCCTERGLLGLAFPPGFTEKRYFYVSYTSVERPNIPFGALVVSRFYLTQDPNVGDLSREEILLVVPKPHEAHNGGHIEFGPRDGYLYIGIGDGGPGGGGEGRSQLLNLHLGKILRIDPENNRPQYALPPNNPFAASSGARGEIWSLGLRNPWGMAFDWATGDLFVADTGETEWEEISVQRADSRGGENYGWPQMEGRQCFKALACNPAGLVTPVTEYHHLEGCALVGGAVARADRYSQLMGAYLYGDFCSGRLWALRNTGSWAATPLGEAGFAVSTLGRDEAGNVYVADYGRGRIFLLEEVR